MSNHSVERIIKIISRNPKYLQRSAKRSVCKVCECKGIKIINGVIANKEIGWTHGFFVKPHNLRFALAFRVLQEERRVSEWIAA